MNPLLLTLLRYAVPALVAVGVGVYVRGVYDSRALLEQRLSYERQVSQLRTAVADQTKAAEEGAILASEAKRRAEAVGRQAAATLESSKRYSAALAKAKPKSCGEVLSRDWSRGVGG